MRDLMKLLDTKLFRMRVVKSQLPDSELGVTLKDSKRGPLVNFEQVKTVVGQWIADQKPEPCNWKQEDDWDNSGTWTADCGLCWSMIEGSPKENGMNFCPGCGKPLIEVPFVREQDEEEE